MSSIHTVTHTASGNKLRRPYHAQGTAVQSYAEAVASVGFSLVSKPVVNPFTSLPVEGEVGVFRNDTFGCLGIHSPNFTYSQPADSLALLERAREAVADYGPSWASVRVGEGGRKLSAFLVLDTCITPPKRGDKVGLSLALSDAFDGTGRTSLQLCANVLACDNGMVSARSLVSFNAKHNPNLRDKLDVFAGSLAMNLAMEVQAMQDTVTKLDNTPMAQGEVEPFARVLLGVEANAKPDDIPTRTQTKLDAIITGFTRGTGNQGRTRWDMLNSVTEYLDHGANYRETNNSREDNRFASLFNGEGANIRARAMELLLN